MSITKLQNQEKKKKIGNRKFNKKNIIDGILIILIIISSIDITYITLPIFLTISFILLQFKRMVDNKIIEIEKKEKSV